MRIDIRNKLSEETSVLLDAIRFSAALAVLIGHFTQPAFSAVWPNLTTFSIAAVGAFFVMSGFVIEYTHTRHPDLKDFARARLIRLWSVVIPALLYTAIVDYISWSCNPSYYAEWQKPIIDNSLAFIADVGFFNESWAQELSFGSDNPIWSLGYEASYYAIFGVTVYLRGPWRLLAIAGIAVAKGPQIFILLPIWLLGVLTCKIALYGENHRVSSYFGVVLFIFSAMVLFFGKKDNTYKLQVAMDGLPGGAGHSPFFFTMLSCGLATSAFVLLSNDVRKYWGPAMLYVRQPIQWLAQSTFSIYLFHLPTLILIQAVTGYSRSSVGAKTMALVSTFVICLALSFATERKKSWWDAPVRRLLRIPNTTTP